MRSRASEILDIIYCVATYPIPSTPSPIAMGVLFRRNHRRVAEIMTQFEIFIHIPCPTKGDVGQRCRMLVCSSVESYPSESSTTRLGMSWLGTCEIPATWKQRLVLIGKACLPRHEALIRADGSSSLNMFKQLVRRTH
jgi:hypothetical protein